MCASPTQIQPGERTSTWTEVSLKVILWGVALGVIQAASPLAFWWLDQRMVWGVSLAVIASVYIGFAVADGRTIVVAAEVGVTSGFVILAIVATNRSEISALQAGKPDELAINRRRLAGVI